MLFSFIVKVTSLEEDLGVLETFGVETSDASLLILGKVLSRPPQVVGTKLLHQNQYKDFSLDLPLH